MRYWILSSEFPPDSGGGISTYCYHTARMMAEGGIEVTVFVPDNNISATRQIDQIEGFEVVRFKPGGEPCFSYLGYEAAVSFQISDQVSLRIDETGKPDYIESQDFQGLGYYTFQRIRTLEEKFSGIKTICTAHAPNFLYLEYNQFPKGVLPEFFIGEFEKSVLRAADITFFPSQYLLDELSNRMELADVNAHVLLNPFSSPPPIKRSKIKRNEIVFFGKLTPQKGSLKLLNYMAKLWDGGFEHPLYIIGGGNYFFYPMKMDMVDFVKQRFKRFVDDGKLIFEGHIPPEQLQERLATAHVILVPSITDNLPYTVIESMSQGKVVLASKSGGQSELIEDGKTGFLFDHDVDFEEKLKQVLAKTDKEIQSIAKHARKFIVEQTAYPKVLSDKLKLLKSIAEDNRFYKSIAGHVGCEYPVRSDEDELTVVIPYYNMGDLVQQTIRSIRKTKAVSQILVVNDGSTDDYSLHVLEAIAKAKDVTVLSIPNQGLAHARNYGAEQTTTKLVAFLDADDVVLAPYYKRARAILNHYDNVSFVGCWAQYFGKSSSIWPTFDPEPPFLLVHNQVNSSALVYKREHFLEAGMNKPDMVYGMEDYESVVSMIDQGMVGCVIPEALWKYRIRTDSMAQQFNRYSQLYLYQLIAEKHADFFGKHAVMVSSLLNANGPGFLFDNPTKRRLAPGSVKIPLADSKWLQAAKRNRYLRSVGKKVIRNFTK